MKFLLSVFQWGMKHRSTKESRERFVFDIFIIGIFGSAIGGIVFWFFPSLKSSENTVIALSLQLNGNSDNDIKGENRKSLNPNDVEKGIKVIYEKKPDENPVISVKKTSEYELSTSICEANFLKDIQELEIGYPSDMEGYIRHCMKNPLHPLGWDSCKVEFSEKQLSRDTMLSEQDYINWCMTDASHVTYRTACMADFKINMTKKSLGSHPSEENYIGRCIKLKQD